ncbi:MAG: hypothetical protein AVDCRST_MAG09-772, partial [uncultured Sphingomonas sp.]
GPSRTALYGRTSHWRAPGACGPLGARDFAAADRCGHVGGVDHPLPLRL